MLGKATMIAVLLAPTASIARHDDHRTEAKAASLVTHDVLAARSPNGTVSAFTRVFDALWRHPGCALRRGATVTTFRQRLLGDTDNEPTFAIIASIPDFATLNPGYLLVFVPHERAAH
jgi:hypothetical protein